MKKRAYLAIAASALPLVGAGAAAPVASADRYACLAAADGCNSLQPVADCYNLTDADLAAWDAYVYDGVALPDGVSADQLVKYAVCFGF